MDGDPVTVSVGLRRGNHRGHGWIGKPSQSPQRLAKLCLLDAELMGIVDMLVGATTAFQENRTRGGNPVRRGLGHLQQISLQQTRLHLADTRADLLPIDHAGDKAGDPADAANALPSKTDIIDLEGDLLPGSDFRSRGRVSAVF